MTNIQWACLACGIVMILSALKSSEYSTILRRDNMGPVRSIIGNERDNILNKSWLWAGIALLALIPFVYGFLNYIFFLSDSLFRAYANMPGTIFFSAFCLLVGSIMAIYFLGKYDRNDASLIGLGVAVIGILHAIWMFLIGAIIWLSVAVQAGAGR